MGWRDSIRKIDTGSGVDVELGGESASAIKSAPDLAAAGLQSMTLYQADNILRNMGATEAAADLESMAKAAEVNNPTEFLMVDILTPNVLDAVGAGAAGRAGKIAKLLSKVGGRGAGGMLTRGAVETGAVQHGQHGDFSGSDVAIGSALSGATGKMAEYASKLAPKIKKAYVGMDEHAPKMRQKIIKGGFKPDELTTQLTDKAFDSGAFLKAQPGDLEYNPANLKFERSKNLKGLDKLKFEATNAVDVADRHQAYRRIQTQAKPIIGEEMSEIVSANADEVLPQYSGAGDSMVAAYNEKFEDIVNRANPYDADGGASRKAIENAKANLFGSGDEMFEGITNLPNVQDLHNYKVALQKEVFKVKEAAKRGAALPPDLEAKESIIGFLGEEIKTALNDPRYLRLSNEYAALSEVEKSLENKLFKKDTSGRIQQSVASPSLTMKALGAAKTVAENFGTPIAQTVQTIENKPALMEGLRHLTTKGASSMAGSPEQEGPLFTPMRQPQGIVEILEAKKIPRTTPGVMQNVPLFKAKVAQKFNNPEMVQWVDQITADPKTFERQAPAIMENPMFKEFFETDEYDRVDGIVPYSQQPRATRDIEINSESTTEMVERLHNLNKHRRLD